MTINDKIKKENILKFISLQEKLKTFDDRIKESKKQKEEGIKNLTSYEKSKKNSENKSFSDQFSNFFNKKNEDNDRKIRDLQEVISMFLKCKMNMLNIKKNV